MINLIFLSKDAANKKIIEAHEGQKLIDESLSIAMEESPEMFGTVIMLYINCVIGGQQIKSGYRGEYYLQNSR